MAVKLGEMLIKAGLLTPPKLQEALEYQKTNGGKLGFNLVKLGFVKEEDLSNSLATGSRTGRSAATCPAERCKFSMSVTLRAPIPAKRCCATNQRKAAW